MEMAPQLETLPCVKKVLEGTAAHSTAGRKDLDVQFIDYYSPGRSFVTCHHLGVAPYCITAELCSLMFYLEMTTREFRGKDERGEQII